MQWCCFCSISWPWKLHYEHLPFQKPHRLIRDDIIISLSIHFGLTIFGIKGQKQLTSQMKLSMWCWVGWIRKVGNFRHHILVQIADSNLLRSIFADWNRSTVDLYRRHLNHRPLSERWLCLCIERPWFDFSSLSREFPRHEKGQESSLQIPATFFKSFAVKGKLKTELFLQMLRSFADNWQELNCSLNSVKSVFVQR